MKAGEWPEVGDKAGDSEGVNGAIPGKKRWG